MSTKSYNSQLTQSEARSKVKEGINLAADLVSPTLGPKSRRILIDAEYGELDSNDDGTTIISKIQTKDTQVGMGVKVAKEASAKTNAEEGDGTTSTASILRELVNSLLKESSQDELLFKKDSGSNLEIRKDMRSGMEKVLKSIDKSKIQVTSKDQIAKVGRVSANDTEIGNMIADMYDVLGKDGAITVTEGTKTLTSSEIIEGMSFNNGWIAPQFITNIEREEAILESRDRDVNVLLCSLKIQDIDHIKKIGDVIMENKINDILIVADDLSGVPLNTLIVNKMNQIIRVVAVKAPQLGNQKDLLKDIAAVTGATIIGDDDAIKLSDLSPDHFGKARRVVVSKDKTIIAGTDNRKDEINDRVKLLESRIDKEESEYEKKKIKERISKMSGGIGIVKVGGNTPLEIKDNNAKIVDAVSAVRSALNGGIVPGGGVALLNASKVLNEKNEGEKILKEAITKPFKQILENSDVDVDKILKTAIETGYGYDVENEKMGDLIELGVIDPANVVKASVKNAVSSALMVANLGGALSIIRDDKEDKEE